MLLRVAQLALDFRDPFGDLGADLLPEFFALAVMLAEHDRAALVGRKRGKKSAKGVTIKRPVAEHGRAVPDAPERRSLALWLFAQTYAALAAPELYGHDGMKDIVGLCATKQFFAVDEPDLQKLVSEMSGQRSVANPSSTGTIGDVGQPLVRPDEVRGLRRWRQIIIRSGMQFPIKARLVPYFKRARWRSMVDRNPYREG